MSKPAVVRVQGIEVTLLDGEPWMFAPLALASIKALQARLESFQGGLGPEAVSTITAVALHSLSRNYPNMRREDIDGVFHEDKETGEVVWEKPALIDNSNMGAVMEAIMLASLVPKKGDKNAGKAAAGSPSIGTSSSAA